MSVHTWHAGLKLLRQRPGAAVAQAQAVIVAGASHRWSRCVEARVGRDRTSFVLPGADAPFSRAVRLEVLDSGQVQLGWIDEQGTTEETTDLDHVAGSLDALLERLTSPTHTCRACGEPVLVSAEWFAVFERMHWTCFHYEFEHPPSDRDEECRSPSCPSAAVEPWHFVDEHRDALVGQLLEDLRSSTLAAESVGTQVEREGPGAISATFDENHYVVMVRRVPESRR